MTNKDVQTIKACISHLGEDIKTIDDIVMRWAETNGYTLVANDVWRDAKAALEEKNKLNCENCIHKVYDYSNNQCLVSCDLFSCKPEYQEEV